MTALEELKAALQDARTEAATLRIRVRELAKLVEMAAASDPVLRRPEAVGTCRVYRHGAGEQPKLPHLKQENCVDWNPAGGPEQQDRGAAAIRPAGSTERCVGFEPHPWPIYADDFCVAPVYEAKPGEVARPRFCGRPRSEHSQPASLAHPFLPTPFYPDRCDAKVDEDGRIRTCGRPREEHP